MAEDEQSLTDAPAPAAAPDVYQRAYPWFAGLSLAAAVVFCGGVYALGVHGQRFAEGMSARLGDVEAARAKSLADGGLTEAAIEGYQRALGMPFESADQRKWAQRQLGELLLRENRPGEAAEPLLVCVAENTDYLPAYRLLCRALEADFRQEDLAKAATAWEKAARAQNNAGDGAEACLVAGQAHETAGRADEALEAYRRGHALSASGGNAYAAARLLQRRGGAAEALRMLDECVAGGRGEHLEPARALRDEIAAAGEQHADAPPAG